MGQTVKINPFTGQPELGEPAYGLSVRGVTNSGMTPSKTTIVCADLSGYGDDYFNGYFLQVILGNHELLTIDGDPAPEDFAAAATLEGGTSEETCTVVEKLTSTTYIVKDRSGDFDDGEVILDGINSVDCGAGYPTFAAGAAPEKQKSPVTDYVSITGTFTVTAFGQVVEPLSEVLLIHDSLVAIGSNDADNIFDSSAVTSNRDGSILERTEFIIDVLQGAHLRTERSASGPVEEDAYQDFTISIFDLDSGAIPSDDIDIASITQTMEKSAGGGAFGAALVQPTFAKSAGIVTDSYQFAAANWDVGDLYKLSVSGITATVDGEAIYIPTMVWCNVVLEVANIDTNVESIIAKIDAGFALTGDADEADVLIDKTFYKDNYQDKLTGTMPDNDGDVASVSAHMDATTNLHVVPAAGFADGITDATTVDLAVVDADLVEAKIKAGTTILGVLGTYETVLTGDADVGNVLDGMFFYKDNATSKLEGTMATVALDPALNEYPIGYHVGEASLTAVDAELVTANIKAGATIFGVAGTSTVVDVSDTTAAAGDVATGKYFYTAAGVRTEGTA